jgi:hypothetical protein
MTRCQCQCQFSTPMLYVPHLYCMYHTYCIHTPAISQPYIVCTTPILYPHTCYIVAEAQYHLHHRPCPEAREGTLRPEAWRALEGASHYTPAPEQLGHRLQYLR